MWTTQIDPLVAAGVVVATRGDRRRLCHVHRGGRRTSARSGRDVEQCLVSALSSFAVISYTSNWIYVCFAALGSWLGAYASLTLLHRTPTAPPSVGSPPH